MRAEGQILPAGPELEVEDVETLAELHVRSLPNTVLAALGPAYTGRFYRYMGRSAHEQVWVYRHLPGNAVEAVAIVSLAPGTLFNRLWLRTPLARRVLHLGSWRATRAAARTLRPRLLGGALPPELLTLLVAKHRRRQGVASALLQVCERWLGARGCASYSVRTAERAGNGAIAFYLRVGFQPAARLAPGVLQLQKRIRHPPGKVPEEDERRMRPAR